MTLIIAGTVRLPKENLDAIRPHMVAMMTASQAEDGCHAYNYADDVADSGLIHIFEIWRDQAALDAHFKSEHMARWRAAGADFAISDRRLFLYDVAGGRPL
jgi:quinol monooxygenase YgiN